MSDLLEQLQKIVDEKLEEEGITKKHLELVDLDIEHSPVIAFRGEEFEDAVEAIPCRGGDKYIVKHPMCPHPVSKESLKVMRYRYLINRPRII